MTNRCSALWTWTDKSSPFASRIPALINLSLHVCFPFFTICYTSLCSISPSSFFFFVFPVRPYFLSLWQGADSRVWTGYLGWSLLRFSSLVFQRGSILHAKNRLINQNLSGQLGARREATSLSVSPTQAGITVLLTSVQTWAQTTASTLNQLANRFLKVTTNYYFFFIPCLTTHLLKKKWKSHYFTCSKTLHL